MGDVVHLNIPTNGDIPCDRVLSGAEAANLESVLVLGWDQSGDFYIASSSGDVGKLLMLLELGERETIDQI